MAVCLILNWIFFLFFIFSRHRCSGNVIDGSHTKSTASDHFKNISLTPNTLLKKEDDEAFKIYCYESTSKSLLQVWRSVQLVLEHVPVSYELFGGCNETEVFEKQQQKSLWHPSSWLSSQASVLELPAFSDYCVGIFTREKYAFQLQVRNVNYWRLLQTLLGIGLFLSAPTLSRNSFFHYTSGISFGVVASLLILIYVLSRFIPKKNMSYVILIFGYSFILYILQAFWRDLRDIISNYLDILLAYCLLTAFISFVICYRLGPVKNVRTFNIIQWSMQAIALVLIFFSSEYREVSTALILILFTIRFIPSSYIARLQYFWYRFFPPKVRLLTEMEYLEQGRIETKNGMENLRTFCRSPECNIWKVVGRLKDPVRFANFVETGNHFTDEELLEYNSEDYNEVESDNEMEDYSSESHLYENGYSR